MLCLRLICYLLLKDRNPHEVHIGKETARQT